VVLAPAVLASCDDGCPDGQQPMADGTACYAVCGTAGAQCTAATGGEGRCLQAGAARVTQQDGSGGLPGAPSSALEQSKLCLPTCLFAEAGAGGRVAADGGSSPEGICPAEMQCTRVTVSLDPGAEVIPACFPRK
jgi:hypothetical protein